MSHIKFAKGLKFIRIAGQKEAEILKAKYPNLTDQIDLLDQAAPKYLIWAVKQLLEGYEVREIIDGINSFVANKQRLVNKDLNSYDLPSAIKSVQELGKSRKEKHLEEKEQARRRREKLISEHPSKFKSGDKVRVKRTGEVFVIGDVVFFDVPYIHYMYERENGSTPLLEEDALELAPEKRKPKEENKDNTKPKKSRNLGKYEKNLLRYIEEYADEILDE